MAGFRKAKAEQAALKIGVYGSSGRGKTLTSLLMAEGLAKHAKKRVAFVDTEHGTDFYCKDVPERKVHPKAFDFDALYTKSITDVLRDVQQLDQSVYGVVVIDSITHLWEAAKNSYKGKLNRAGQIPMYAWSSIKKPYKDLMTTLLNSPLHVIICGREGSKFEDDEDTGEMKMVGKKMKAEGETQYEPHILLQMIDPPHKADPSGVYCYVEKDRTGILAFQTIQLWPGDKTAFDILCRRWMSLLGDSQAQMESDDEQGIKDAEVLADQELAKEAYSRETLEDFTAKIQLCKTADELKQIGKAITPDIKKKMLATHVADLRERYQAREGALSGRQVYQEVGAE